MAWINKVKSVATWINSNKASGGALVWSMATDIWSAATYTWADTSSMGASTAWSNKTKY